MDQKPFGYTPVHAREFGAPSEDSLSAHYKEILTE